MTVGENIRNARKAAGLTQKELAQRLGLSFQSIAQWENNLRNPKIETIKKIADALGVDAWTLVDAGDSTMPDLPAGIPDDMKQMARDRAKVLAFAKLDGEREQKLLDQIIKDFYLLTDEGQEKAAERVHELTEIKRYQERAAFDFDEFKAAHAAPDTAGTEPDENDTDTSTEE